MARKKKQLTQFLPRNRVQDTNWLHPAKRTGRFESLLDTDALHENALRRMTKIDALPRADRRQIHEIGTGLFFAGWRIRSSDMLPRKLLSSREAKKLALGARLSARRGIHQPLVTPVQSTKLSLTDLGLD